MEFKDKIKDIRKAKDNGRLVIFVGAGVSKNSSLPTWGELINVFADKLNYHKCESCKFKRCKCEYNEINEDNCEEKYNFSQDEFLKIPQYYYDIDTSNRKENYYNTITKTLNKKVNSNKIDEVIMDMEPDHIITTNYDTLLEDCKNKNRVLYKMVYKDRDLLKKNAKHYIIKMHGDINNPESIVLKESDYTSYSQTHILMETKIKSLLIDHTFLFVGYSLNDYNLKLILGWIDYLAKENNVSKERPKNYIIQIGNNENKAYINSYLEANNVYVINTDEVPSEIKAKNNDIELSSYGKEVYSCLDYINDTNNDYLVEPLDDILIDKYEVFNGFKSISYEDLISVFSFGKTIYYGHDMEIIDGLKYSKLKHILQANGKKSEKIKSIFAKCNINEIFCRLKDNVDTITVNYETNNNEDEKMFSLYLNNNYDKISQELNNISDMKLKIYYFNIINNYYTTNNQTYIDMLNKMKEDLMNNGSIYDLLIYTFNNRAYKLRVFEDVEKETDDLYWILNTLRKDTKKAYKFIEKMINGMSGNIDQQKKLLEKHEKEYLKLDNSTYWGSPYVNLYELRGYAYDYYYYFKYNNLTIDYFSNPMNYLQYYLKAILCTYAPSKNKKSSKLFGPGTQLEEYEINEIDLDMFIKYSKYDDLYDWIAKYNVKALKLLKGLNNEKVINKYLNCCESIINLKKDFLCNYINCFNLVVTKLEMNVIEKEKVVKGICGIIENCMDNKIIVIEILKSILILFNEFNDEEISVFSNILLNLINPEMIKAVENMNEINILRKIIKLLSKYSNDDISNKINNVIDEISDIDEKKRYLFSVRYILNENQKEKYRNILIANQLKDIPYTNLFNLLYDDILQFDDMIKDNILLNIKTEVNERKSNPGCKTFPDKLTIIIENCIILNFMGKISDIEFLREYEEYSIFLKFIFEPEEFDYSKVDINHYMWENLIRNKKYLEIIMKHKDKINIDKIKNAVKYNYATEEEKKFLYRYLCDDNELWKL